MVKKCGNSCSDKVMKINIEKTVRVFKAIAYLASIILPVIDAVRGVKEGVRLGMMDKLERDANLHYRKVKMMLDMPINENTEE